MEGYRTIEGRADFAFEEKKSKFIGHAAHVASEDEAKAFLELIRSENPEATHNVYAWILREGNKERQSDDGEPQKTSGLPTLEVLRHSGLTDVTVVTTRYFGGTLLGTGGLVRAYTHAAQGALEAATQVLVSSCVDIDLKLPYSAYDQASFIIGQQPAKVLDTNFAAEVTMKLRMVEGTQDELVAQLGELLRGTSGIKVSPPHHAAF